MLSSLLLLLTAPALPVAAPAPIEVGLHVGTSEFYAHNYSDRAQVLVFHQDGNHAMYVLAPGEDVRWNITSESLTSVELEIVSRGGYDTWLTTDALVLDGLVPAGVPDVWMQSAAPRSIYWVEYQGSFLRWDTKPGLCAEELITPISSETDSLPEFESLHVPVVTPTGTGGDLPPKIEPVPLPPV
jgi:hypothetical protein